MIAGPSDHGRWYAEESSSGDGFFNILGLIVIGIILVLVILVKLGGEDSSKSGSSHPQKTQESTYVKESNPLANFEKWGAYTKCPKCGGKGSWRGDMVSFDDRGFETCPECHGFKKKFS